jgi:starch-binding outer membrane protein, SusD/RagB family
MKKLIYSAMVMVAALLPSCTDDLNQMPIVETTSAQVYTSAANYKAVLGKLYASYVIAGQEKGGANADLSSNSGYDYMRCYLNLQTCGTEEWASTWLEGDKVGDLTYLTWDANDPFVADTYYRIYYTIALCNELLRNATDGKIAKFTEAEQAEIRQYRAEARFLRALSYYHAMDLYKNVPFVDENDPVGAFTPPRHTADQIFEYIESELKAIEDELMTKAEVDNVLNYGRAPQAAAWTLLARLYLNAKTYTNTPRYTDCITYSKKVIDAGYSLESDYAKLFNADNHKRTNEIIFAFVVDPVNTVSWGASTYLVCGGVSSTSEFQKAADYGVKNGWGSFRARGELPSKFEANDKRAMFFTEGQSLTVDVIDNQSNGYLVTKWTNLTDAGEASSNTGSDGVDTDFPMFRLADVYLMLAESVIQGGTGSSISEALLYVNELRKRAFGSDTEGQVTASALTADFILDERARELYWEGIRRTDLIRHNKFTTADYLWQWKGGVKEGKAVDKKFNYYPIPTTDLTANPNLKNEEY